LSRIRRDPGEEIQRQSRLMAKNMLVDKPETTGEELDLKKLFVRILREMTGPINSLSDLVRFEARFVDLKGIPNSRKSFDYSFRI